jgi:aldose sugar dehydrogenase
VALIPKTEVPSQGRLEPRWLQRLLAPLTVLAAVIGLITVPALWLAPPVFWRLAPEQLLSLLAIVLAYGAAFFLVGRRMQSSGRSSLSAALTIGLACLGLVTILLVLTEPTSAPWIPRPALATALGIGLAALLLTRCLKSGAITSFVLVSLIAGVGLAGQFAYRQQWLPRPVPPHRVVKLLDTSLYQLRRVEYRGWIPHHWRVGGGLAYWDDDYLLATGDGRLYIINEDASHSSLRFTALPRPVPLNTDEFSRAAAEIFRDRPNNFVESARFRVGGVLVMDHDGKRRILVSHHHWETDRSCFVMRLSMLEGRREQFSDPSAPLEWRTIYDAQPCLTLNTTNPAGPRFEGLENGGRMAALGGNEILLTVGVHAFDGVTRPENIAQDPTSGYGKIMRINVASGEHRIFTSGHRNPQGLHIGADGAIWSTEHGPRGGDELNRIVEGRNYGWATVTYGTDYARRSWPLQDPPDSQTGFEGPIYSFVPSIGLSALTSAGDGPFGRWKGDLLIGTLKGQTLFRAHIRDDRLVVLEPFPMGARIRDVITGHDGRLVIWTDDSSVIFLAPTDVNEGESLSSTCVACHSLASWDSSSALGPNLHGIVNRKVASRTDFRYSPALQKLGGRWTPERLDAFLANPQGYAPGTSMAFPGIQDPAQRKKVVDYLGNMAMPD